MLGHGLGEAFHFALALWRHGSALVTCAGVGVITLALDYFTKWKLPRRFVASVVLGALLIACFLAWRDEYRETEVQADRIAALSADKTSLQREKADLRKERDRLQAQVTTLTEGLARAQEKARSIASAAPPPPPLPQKGIIIVRQTDMPPSADESLRVREVVLRTKADLQPAWLVLKCDAPIRAVTYYLASGANVGTQGKYYSADRKTVWFHFATPAFTVEDSLIVRLTGSEPIRALDADEQHPPPGLKEEGRTGVQVVM